jgi:hypothetical protein
VQSSAVDQGHVVVSREMLSLYEEYALLLYLLSRRFFKLTGLAIESVRWRQLSNAYLKAFTLVRLNAYETIGHLVDYTIISQYTRPVDLLPR